jgi:hypothetical protein
MPLLIYRTPRVHHVSLSKVMKTECGRTLSNMDMVRVCPDSGLRKSEFRELWRLRPFCKTCMKAEAWKDMDWRSEDEEV